MDFSAATIAVARSGELADALPPVSAARVFNASLPTVAAGQMETLARTASLIVMRSAAWLSIGLRFRLPAKYTSDFFWFSAASFFTIVRSVVSFSDGVV